MNGDITLEARWQWQSAAKVNVTKSDINYSVFFIH